MAKLDEVMRDANVAYHVGKIVAKHSLTEQQTTEYLRTCGVERAETVAHIAMGEGWEVREG